MRIGIIGAGSIGLLFAAYLSETLNVIVYTRTKKQALEINQNGIILIKGNLSINKKVKAMPIDDWNGLEDLTIVTVKQYQLESIIKKFSHITDRALTILFLQNGMSHLKLLKSLMIHHIFVGTVEHGALKENGFKVMHNGEGVTNLALYSGDPALLKTFLSAVPEGFQIRWNESYYEMLLDKLMINAAINPLTAILQVQNGMLIKNDCYFKVLKNLIAEVAEILNLTDPDAYLQKVIDVCYKTADNRSSMLKDIESGRKTEVDAILGFLLEEAQDHEKSPALIQSFYLLVKGKENGHNG